MALFPKIPANGRLPCVSLETLIQWGAMRTPLVLLAAALAYGCRDSGSVEVDCSPGSPIKPGNPAICMVRNTTRYPAEVCWSVRFFDACAVSETHTCAEAPERLITPVEVYSDCEKSIDFNTTNGPAMDVTVDKQLPWHD